MNGTKYLLRVAEVPVFPELEWGIVIGDAVHCLRSALDQLVTSLCTEPSRRTAFPICRTKKDWAITAPAQIWSLPEDYAAVINAAQPYHRGNDNAHLHPLAILNELWNLDKHEAIPAVALVPSKIKIKVTRTVNLATWTAFRTHPGRALEEGTVLGESTITQVDAALKANMYVDSHISIDVGFGQIPKASSVSLKPVGKTFREQLVRAVMNVWKELLDVHVASVTEGRR